MKNYIDRWDSDVFENKEISKLIFDDVKNKLKYMPHPFHGWRSIPNQKYDTVFINEHGLRNKSFKDFDKNKKNCILLGGSVAWGFGASSNDFIPSNMIEIFLEKKYNLHYNVINLAEQMHSSFEELQTFITTVDELDPKLIICLSGTNDINRGYADLFKITDLNIQQLNYFLNGHDLGLIREKNLFLKISKIIFRNHKLKTKIFSKNYHYNKPEKSKIPFKLIQNKLLFMKNYCQEKNTKFFQFLQPDLTTKKNLTLTEKNYYDWIEEDRKIYVKENLKILEDNFFKDKNPYKNSFFISLLDIFDEVEGSIFFDKAHLGNKGYKIMSEVIADEIGQKIKNNL